MEIYNGILCISGTELIRSDDNPTGVLSMAMYRKFITEKPKRLNVVRRGGNGRTALIEFDSLPIKYRQVWEQLHGDPHKMKVEPTMAERITPDWNAKTIFSEYRYDNTSLPTDVQLAYCHDAEIFNALTNTLEVTRNARSSHKKSMCGIWQTLSDIVNELREHYAPNNMPSTAITLRRKYERYIKEGYYSLIHANYGNKNAYKLKSEESKAALMKIAAKGERYAAPTAVKLYNGMAELHGWEPITERSYINFLKKHEYVLKASREGNAAWANSFDQNINRERPSAPLLLINSDDNNLDFFFRSTRSKVVGDKVRTVSTDYYRYKMYIVLDAHCDYVLGYALGDEITLDLVAQAYRNAANHVRKLTGGYYMWHQIVADHWSPTAMKEFLGKQAKTTLAQVGNPKSKYIERFFGVEWHETQKLYNNHSGYNIVAKTKPNSDWIEKNKKNFPTKEEGIAQIAHFIERLRSAQWQDSGKSRQQIWLEHFFESAKSKQNTISDQVFLDIFGVQRYKKGGAELEHNRITNNGINITINGQKYDYSVPDDLYRATIGKDAYTIIDPADLSRVLIRTTDDKHSFVARQTRIVPSCFADMVVGDMEYWHSRLHLKEDRKKEINAELAKYREVADNYDVEGYLQTGNLTKGINQQMADAYMAQISSNDSIHNLITS